MAWTYHRDAQRVFNELGETVADMVDENYGPVIAAMPELVNASVVALRIVRSIRGPDNDVVLALTAALGKAGVK